MSLVGHYHVMTVPLLRHEFTSLLSNCPVFNKKFNLDTFYDKYSEYDRNKFNSHRMPKYDNDIRAVSARFSATRTTYMHVVISVQASLF